MSLDSLPTMEKVPSSNGQVPAAPPCLNEPPITCLAAELPTDILERIFAALGSADGGSLLAELSSAACVCKSWRVAAFSPRFWKQLSFERIGLSRAQRVDDKALFSMMARSAGQLTSLDLSTIEYTNVTTSGVIAALEAGGYSGKLKTLKVSGILLDASAHRQFDGIDVISSFLADGAQPLDVPVRDHAVCTGTPSAPSIPPGRRGPFRIKPAPAQAPLPLCGRICADAPFCVQCRTAASLQGLQQAAREKPHRRW